MSLVVFNVNYIHYMISVTTTLSTVMPSSTFYISETHVPSETTYSSPTTQEEYTTYPSTTICPLTEGMDSPAFIPDEDITTDDPRTDGSLR